MRRLTIFSHFDKYNNIADYVVYYLSELSKYSDIIFVSDCCNINDTELSKIKPHILHFIINKHEEYDFGSYKYGFAYALDQNLLQKYDELIFANDSCYAPIYSFNDLFKKMEKNNDDFWGVTANFNSYFSKEIHVQSYFIAFHKQVFTSNIFKNFITNIKKETCKKNIVNKYEIGLTNILINNNFSFDVYSNFSKKHYASHILYYKNLLKDRIPFLKRSIPLLRANFIPLGFINFIKINSSYNVNLIKKDFVNKNKIDLIFIINLLYKTISRFFIIVLRLFISCC